MKYRICSVSVAPLRSNSLDKAEQVSQILFGEVVEILEQKGTWLKVRCTWDDYIAWADEKQLLPITQSEFEAYLQDFAIAFEWVQPLVASNHFIPLLLGATLPNFDGISSKIAFEKYTYSGQVVYPKTLQATPTLIQKIAKKFLYAPYLWGGRSVFGIDCSGMTQLIYKMLGVKIPRDAYQQVGIGEMVGFVEYSQVGDLAFFENKKGRVAHVGLILEDAKIIHAHGRVRIDALDHYGIYNQEKQKYTHKLRVIKRYLPTFDTTAMPTKYEKQAILSQPNLFETN